MMIMVREEAIRELNTFKIGAKSELGETALDMAIKALKQEDILDKIRAEIVELRSKQNVGVMECLDIIDKYKAESEGK